MIFLISRAYSSTKTKIMKKLTFFALTFLALSACKKDPNLTPSNKETRAKAPFTTLSQANTTSGNNGKNSRCLTVPPPVVVSYCGPVTTVNLIAGLSTNVGTVTVGNNSENAFVTYTITDPAWKLNDLKLFVGDCNLIPKSNCSSPTTLQFPYTTSFSTGLLTYTFAIPLSSLPSCYCIAASATVSKPGSCGIKAWGAGTPFVNGGSSYNNDDDKKKGGDGHKKYGDDHKKYGDHHKKGGDDKDDEGDDEGGIGSQSNYGTYFSTCRIICEGAEH